MLLVDGVAYDLIHPELEEEVEKPFKENYDKVFGQDSVLLDVKLKLKSFLDEDAIPDGFAIRLGKDPKLYIVEVEKAKHHMYRHVMTQLGQFLNWVEEPENKDRVVEALYENISEDPVLSRKVGKWTAEIHRYVNGIIRDAEVLVVADELTNDLKAVCRQLGVKKLVELQTYARRDAPSVRGYLFNGLGDLAMSVPKDAEEEREPTEQIGNAKQLQYDFWQNLVAYAARKYPDMELRRPRRQHWFNVKVGKSGVGIALTAKTRANVLGCELYISRDKSIFRKLESERRAIEKELGERLSWEPLPHKKAARIALFMSGDIREKAQWDEFYNWLLDNALKFQRVFGPRLHS